MYCCRWDICWSPRCHRWLGTNRQWYSGTRGLTVCNCADSGQRRLLPTVEPQSAPHSWQPGVHRGGQCSNLWGKVASVVRGHACSVSSSCSSMATATSNCTDLDGPPINHHHLVCMSGRHLPLYQDYILSSTQRTVRNFTQHWIMFHTTYNTGSLHNLSPDWLITTARYCVSHNYANGTLSYRCSSAWPRTVRSTQSQTSCP
jgi:hypothetical protein